MDWLLLGLVVLLLALGFGVTRRWNRAAPQQLSYSIIVACRNEEANLPRLLASLRAIDYPADKLEFLLVDDASTDGTLALLEAFAREAPNARALRVDVKDPAWGGKTGALHLAATQARHDILLLTDADCRVSPQWPASYNDCFTDNVGMVAGFSPEEGASSFRRFTQLVSAAMFASTIGLGVPFSCVGRNLAIRRAALEKAGGYASIRMHPMGDDKLMLRRIRGAGYRIAYNPLAPAVTIRPQAHAAQQNRRRYGKFRSSSTLYQLLSLLVLAAYAWMPVRVVTGGAWPLLLAYLAAALFFWLRVLRVHGQRFLPVDALYLIVYPYYLIYWSVLGTLGGWKWKS